MAWTPSSRPGVTEMKEHAVPLIRLVGDVFKKKDAALRERGERGAERLGEDGEAAAPEDAFRARPPGVEGGAEEAEAFGWA